MWTESVIWIVFLVLVIAVPMILAVLLSDPKNDFRNKYHISYELKEDLKKIAAEYKTKESKQESQTTVLPAGISLDINGLPYKTNRKYLQGWGKQFNAFVTPQGKYYHKSKCRYCKGHQYSCIHVYDAIERGYLPCPYCKPKDKVDDWYTTPKV